MIIAIDGPSGSGKSSVSRAVARQLGLEYLDTGAMYRAMTWYLLQNGVDVHDAAAVAAAAPHALITPSTDPDAPGIAVAGTDVSGPIREEVVTSAVSAVSAVPEVRAIMLAQQRAIAAAAQSGIVVEGRDIAAVVLPNADVKIFLTADAQQRAARRATQASADMTDTQARLEARDRADSTRAVSPFTRADDALLLDTTHLDLNEVVQHVIAVAGNRD
jgi:cytidylate kinase